MTTFYTREVRQQRHRQSCHYRFGNLAAVPLQVVHHPVYHPVVCPPHKNKQEGVQERLGVLVLRCDEGREVGGGQPDGQGGRRGEQYDWYEEVCYDLLDRVELSGSGEERTRQRCGR